MSGGDLQGSDEYKLRGFCFFSSQCKQRLQVIAAWHTGLQEQVSMLHCKAEERLQFTDSMVHQNADSCWQSWVCKAEERLHFTRLFGSGCHIQWVVDLCLALDPAVRAMASVAGPR